MNRLALRIASSLPHTLSLPGSPVRRAIRTLAGPILLRTLTPPAPTSWLHLPSAAHSTHTKASSTPKLAAVSTAIVKESEKVTVSGELELESSDHQRRFLLAFTCKVCNTRQSKLVTHHAYTKGVVLARCDGCQNVHLISDNKNWFMEGRNVEEIIQKQDPAEKIQKLSFRAKDAQSQAYLERLLKEDPALLERLVRTKVEAMRKAQANGGASAESKATAAVKITIPA